ncbi:hypothetical protein J0H58_27705 [bacterium]|nr:hypothetical protein [bacterium]
MPREIETHKVNGCNEALKLTAEDDPGCGGANHHYQIRFPDKTPGLFQVTNLRFQNGPIKEAGVNGVTHEVLLAILIDRLEGFQSGQYACDDNAEALTHLRAAVEVLHRRTKARAARGVEGTHAV